MNPFVDASPSNEKLSTSVQQNALANPWADLLTGGDTFCDPVFELVTRNVLHEGNDLLDFLDQAVVEHHGAETDHNSSSKQGERHQDSGTHQYINCLKSLAGSHMVSYFSLVVVLSHEIILNSLFI